MKARLGTRCLKPFFLHKIYTLLSLHEISWHIMPLWFKYNMCQENGLSTFLDRILYSHSFNLTKKELVILKDLQLCPGLLLYDKGD